MHIKSLLKHAILPAVFFFNVVTANAGALFTDPVEKNPPAIKKQTSPIGTAVTGAGNVTPLTKNPDVLQKMTCWQYGKLIFEQTVIAPKDKVTDMRLLENPENGEVMLAFDFKNAFCFIK
jgi:hypothetical protein